MKKIYCVKKTPPHVLCSGGGAEIYFKKLVAGSARYSL